MSETKPKGTIGGGVMLALLLSSVLILGAGVMVYGWSATQLASAEELHQNAERKQDSKEAAEQAQNERDLEIAREKEAKRKADAAAAALVRAEQARKDKAATDQGYYVIPGDVSIYYKAHEGDYTCTSEGRCAVFTVMTADPCPEGIAVTVSALDGDVSVGAVYGVTAGLPATGVAQLELAMPGGDKFQVTEAHCMD
ncbi:hypothetical protein [Leifsonia sp. Leaf264]|uniref:hypothetical protein n=1 Tax=Leifsonia sp. Leaf264 TaxID=1736314 RepID=UPI000701FB92|nr:hypothetical protein [Leifsonia sp. Leaf264]KQO98496.1 hypothetical protein ASF30_10565 [Leifsonia sp. Leaf264]